LFPLSAGFDARLKRLEAAVAAAAPETTIIEIFNDPERRRAGPDEAEIGGVLYQRLEGEEGGAWYARLRAAAQAAGEAMVLISMEQDYGLDDHVVDVAPGETIEIGEAVQEGGKAARFIDARGRSVNVL
jgi:hypothetical protein